jgi:S-(hydroxymethyl)glutathione dehydrogenase/alcohol dehydrogenase
MMKTFHIPKYTQAAILIEQNKPLVVANISLPDKLTSGHVLVKVHFSTICGAQLNEIDGAKGVDKYLPHLLGHEASGTVVAIGPGVTTVRTGDTVVMHWRQSSGIQAEPAKYSWKGKPVNAGWVTTFQTYSVVSENRLTVIPSGFDLQIAPLFGCAVTTAMGVVNNDAQVKVGQSVVVFGTGGVGLSIIQAAAMVSAYPIIGVDLIDSKLVLAKKFGATHTFSAKIPTLDGKIIAIVGPKGSDVVIDTTGNGRVIEHSYELTHPDGKTILVGVPNISDKVSIYTLPLHFKKILKGSHGGSSTPDVDIPRYIRLYQANKLKLKGIITHTFPLLRINEAIALMRSGSAGRVLLRMKS